MCSKAILLWRRNFFFFLSHLGWMLRCPWGDQKSNRVSLYRLSFFPTKETSPGIAFILSSVAWLFCGHGERVKLNILSKHMMMILHYLVNKIFRNFYKFKIIKENERNSVKMEFQRTVNSECLGLKYFQVIISNGKLIS